MNRGNEYRNGNRTERERERACVTRSKEVKQESIIVSVMVSDSEGSSEHGLNRETVIIQQGLNSLVLYPLCFLCFG